MPEFRYRGKTSDNKNKSGKIQARNAADAFDFLKTREIYAYKVEEISRVENTKVKFKSKELADFCRQLGTMLSAGVPITKSLSVLAEQDTSPRYKKIYDKLYQTINMGNSLSSAMEDCKGTFPELMINMFKAGEATGSIDKSAMKMAEYYDKESKLTAKIKGAMTYPIILLILTVGVTLMLFTFVVPRFTTLLQGREIPAVTRILLGISNIVTTYWYLLLFGAFILGVLVYYLFKIPAFVMKVDAAKLKIPVAGKLFTVIYTARFARTLSSLYSSGVNMMEAVDMSSKTIGNKRLVRDFEKVNLKVRDGNPLSSSMGEIKGIEKKLSAAIYVGEETGRLDQMLDSMASTYDFEAEVATTRLLGLMEPIMIIIMTLIVGFVLLGVMLPMMSTYNTFL